MKQIDELTRKNNRINQLLNQRNVLLELLEKNEVENERNVIENLQQKIAEELESLGFYFLAKN